MLRALSLFVVLMAFWLLLSGHYHLSQSEDRFLAGCGVGSCLFVVWLSRRMGIVDEEGHPVQLALRGLIYVPWLMWQIILSNWDVFKRVWNPKLPISPGLVRVPYGTRSDLGTVIYANSITLTPGTVTVNIDHEKRELLVHCLTESGGQDLLGGGMERHVRKFEG